MIRWAPWLLTFVVWNGAFDLQVKYAAERFTDRQVERWRRQDPPELIRDAFTPDVREAALRSSALAAVVLALGMTWQRRRAARSEFR